MRHKYTIPLLILIAIMATISCSGGEMEQKKINYSSLKDIPAATWEELSEKTFYFGHQSVGYNILEGVQDIMKQYPQIKLKIVESTDAADMVPGTLVHSKVGQNTKPNTKIDDFVRYIDGGIGETADAVAMKLCYVDILANADPEKLFAEYEHEVNKIRNAFPKLKIIHFTVPLTKIQTGPKKWIKKILGREILGIEDNIKKSKYNELLLKEYFGRDPIFDMAEIESTFPDGTRSTFEVDGKTYYSLVPEYTNDDGHLNEVGRKKVAEQLILLLANL